MRSVTLVLAGALAATPPFTTPRVAAAGRAALPLALASARVSLEGMSNIHGFTASTTTVRVAAIEIGGTPAGDLLDHLLQPGGLAAFEVTIPAASLTSPRDGVDKNMHKALKVPQHPDIRFRLRALETVAGVPAEASAKTASYRALGWVTIAGVEREVALSLQVERKESTLAVTGSTDLLMTDFGIAPPKAMLGMLRTNPKVQIRIELVLRPSLT